MSRAADAVLAVAAEYGTAARYEPRDDGHTVDVWTLHPRLGDPVHLLCVRSLRHQEQRYAILLAGIDPAIAAKARHLGLPPESAYLIHLLEPVAVHTDGHARDLTAQLVRQTTTGTLTARPDTPEEQAAWRAVIAAIAATLTKDPARTLYLPGRAEVAVAPI